MPCHRLIFATAALTLATLAPAGLANADDLEVRAKPIFDFRFFSLIDNRVTLSYIPQGTGTETSHSVARSFRCAENTT
jgi:hypothetical protein